jgi:hypothetical protein
MGSMLISTAQGGYNIATVQGTTTNFATGAGVTDPSTSKPSAGVVFDATVNNELPSLIRIVPFVRTNSLTNPSMRLIGWTQYANAVWIPTTIAYFDLVQGSGPSATIDGATTYFYDTMTQDSTASPEANVYSPGGFASAQVGAASAVCDMAGFQVVTMQFEASGNATAGVLWATL